MLKTLGSKRQTMKSKLKLKFRVGDLVQFLEEDSCADEHDDYGIVIKIKKLTDDFGNNKSYNHYGIFWIVNNETTFEGMSLPSASTMPIFLA